MACRGIIASLAAVVLLGLTMRALADGKVFEVAGPPALIPEQSALIHYQGGIETLAIETRFAGKGLEFGWVVPLPARPEITPSTAGLFPTLRATAVPEIIQPVNLLWCLIVFFLAAWIFIGMKSRPVAIVLTVVVLVLGGALCLVPTLGRARGIGSEPGPDVRVLDRQIVGSFEVATLAADGAADLRRWLADNRFQVPAACDAALDAYARDRWVFAACKLRREQATGATFATHPLVFRFKTARAVYPMQLTGAGATEPVSLDLYVFADRSARCDGLEIERCLPTRGEWNKDAHIDAERAMPVWHPSLVALAGTAPWMTKLVGTLSPGAMTHDLYLDWFEPRVIGAAAYSSSGATLVSSHTASQ